MARARARAMARARGRARARISLELGLGLVRVRNFSKFNFRCSVLTSSSTLVNSARDRQSACTWHDLFRNVNKSVYGVSPDPFLHLFGW